MLKMVDGTGIIGVDMICPLGISTPQPPNYDRVELEGTGMLVLPNSLDAPLERLELGGKTAQVTTTGAQLFDIDKFLELPSVEGGLGRRRELVIKLKPTTKYTMSSDIAGSTSGSGAVNRCLYFSQATDNGLLADTTCVFNNHSITQISDGEGHLKITLFDRSIAESIISRKNYVMLNEGSAAQPYEPYTGNKPSPSPEYPQEIKNSGKWNEEKQKYEVVVKAIGKNLFDIEKAKDKSKWTPCALSANFVEIAVYVGTGSTVTASNNVKIDNPVYYYGVALKSSEDIKYFICYPGYPNSKDTHTFTATEDYIYVRCNKTSLNDVIGVCGGLQIEIGASRTDFESYKEQSLTLTSDRHLTKWDRLVEQGGQIGWLYGGVVIDRFDGQSNKISIANKQGDVQNFSIRFENVANGNGNSDIFVDKYRAVQLSYTKAEYGICCNWNDGVKYFSAPNENVATVDEFKAWLVENPLKIAYETTKTEFVPLPQSEQNAIRALKTYYPTTVITADGGELDPDIKVTYRKEI